MDAFLLHGGDLELSDWLLLALFWVVLPLALLVFLSFRLGAYLRKREHKKRLMAVSTPTDSTSNSTLPSK